MGDTIQCEAPSVQRAACTCLAGSLFGVLDALKHHQGPVDTYDIVTSGNRDQEVQFQLTSAAGQVWYCGSKGRGTRHLKTLTAHCLCRSSGNLWTGGSGSALPQTLHYTILWKGKHTHRAWLSDCYAYHLLINFCKEITTGHFSGWYCSNTSQKNNS